MCRAAGHCSAGARDVLWFLVRSRGDAHGTQHCSMCSAGVPACCCGWRWRQTSPSPVGARGNLSCPSKAARNSASLRAVAFLTRLADHSLHAHFIYQNLPAAAAAISLLHVRVRKTLSHPLLPTLTPPPVALVSPRRWSRRKTQPAEASSSTPGAAAAENQQAPPAGTAAAAATPGTEASDTATAAPTPPPPPPETPPAVRRAAVSERVAREVLNFMAAIERGELTAVGLPEVPGAAMFEGAGLGGGGGGRGERSAPALEQVVKNLPRIQVSVFFSPGP